MTSTPERVLVVVSYYDKRPVQELDELLRSLATTPSGFPFHVRVVVNQDGDVPTDLATRYPDIQVMHRRNAGYNIGAWDHGWRAEPAYDAYLFLQHECVLSREGWLRPYVDRLEEPGVGLVGERINPAWDATWDEVEQRFLRNELPDHFVDGRPANRLETYRHFFAVHDIDPGDRADHLQTLVLFTRRETLVRMDGFPVGRNYGEAIAAEIAISKKVQSLGLGIRQVGPEPFHCLTHPQWRQRAEQWRERARRRPRAPRVALPQWLDQIRSRDLFVDGPWLVLGKGPTFSLLREEHRTSHHLLGLNHVVRELPLAVAHIIDLDVVEACADSLPVNCQYLLMPRVPHVNAAPGDRLLEDYFDTLPVLDDLDRQGRLVWYNCSTGRSRPGSPVIEVEHFSSEAAFEILGRMGVRTVRSLGVDGGRMYSPAFFDLSDTTRLANGRPLFDLQFERIRKIVTSHGMDYAPLAQPIRVFIGGDASLALPAKVLEYSIRKHASLPMEFVSVTDRERVPAGATYFDAATVAFGDAAGLQDRPDGPPPWLLDCGPLQPWCRPEDPAAERWLDVFAEAVNAAVVRPADVRRAIAAGHASPVLRHLPAPSPVVGGAAVDRLEHRARCLNRELANLRQSLTLRVGRLFLAPVLALLHLLRK